MGYTCHYRGASREEGQAVADTGHTDGLRRLLTVPEAAKIVGCSKAHLYNVWINPGILPVVRLGRAVRIDPEDLARVIEQAKMGGRVR